MKLTKKAWFGHVYKLYRTVAVPSQSSTYLISKRSFCKSSNDDKLKGNTDNESKENRKESIFSFLTNQLSSMDPFNAKPNMDDPEIAKFSQMYDDIEKENKFELDIDPNNTEQLRYYESISSPDFQWMNNLLPSKNPLTPQEFLVGAYHGMKFMLKCLDNDDKDSLSSCVADSVLQQFDDLKKFLIGFDDNGNINYGSVDKIMLYLSHFENIPSWQNATITCSFKVTYYYQLKHKMDDNEQEYIQKRADIIWQSKWLPDLDKWMVFEISDDGWIVQTVDSMDIPKSN